MTESAQENTHDQVLDLIVEKGPVTTRTIAQILNLTTAAVRRHITSLEHVGSIEEYDVSPVGPRGRGRPSKYYVATDTGRESLDDRHSELAVQILKYFEQLCGTKTVEGFAASRARELERRYTPIVRAIGSDTRLRAQVLANVLTEDGYAASIRPVGDGKRAVQLCQGLCPIETVARKYPQLCEAELQAFSNILDVHVQRLATLAQGKHVCTTNVPMVARTGTRSKMYCR